ncbi:hypothetical protein JKP88DRAFT_249310 [Tribonema minus]|uniref:Uncharacterized protein n=1 Tax=Tribonema minus TaxID=303371 RepID=A0A835YNG5_9STRA|nr:hypothetical protein JKP88DRAFT_249310 [Tribonema minus]
MLSCCGFDVAIRATRFAWCGGRQLCLAACASAKRELSRLSLMQQRRVLRWLKPAALAQNRCARAPLQDNGSTNRRAAVCTLVVGRQQQHGADARVFPRATISRSRNALSCSGSQPCVAQPRHCPLTHELAACIGKPPWQRAAAPRAGALRQHLPWHANGRSAAVAATHWPSSSLRRETASRCCRARARHRAMTRRRCAATAASRCCSAHSAARYGAPPLRGDSSAARLASSGSPSVSSTQSCSLGATMATRTTSQPAVTETPFAEGPTSSSRSPLREERPHMSEA